MYVPKLFNEPSAGAALELIRSFPFATVVGAHSSGELEIAHVPLLATEGSTLVLAGHVARGNPFAKLVAANAPATAVFNGPDAYVSAAWYESPREHVPTWNYAVVHVTGTLRQLDDTMLAEHLGHMASNFESGEREPWSPELLDPAFFSDLRRGIVGFELSSMNVVTKVKLSQNRSANDRARVEAALEASSRGRDREVAAQMAANRAKLG